MQADSLLSKPPGKPLYELLLNYKSKQLAGKPNLTEFKYYHFSKSHLVKHPITFFFSSRGVYGLQHRLGRHFKLIVINYYYFSNSTHTHTHREGERYVNKHTVKPTGYRDYPSKQVCLYNAYQTSIAADSLPVLLLYGSSPSK